MYIIDWFNKMINGERSAVTQTIGQASAKLGRLHEISVKVDGMTNGGTNKTIFVTGALPVILRSRIASYTGSGVALNIYENAEYTGGTDVVSYNLNKRNPVAPIAKFISGATITNTGSQAFKTEYLIGNNSNNGQGGTGIPTGEPKILEANTIYNFEIISNDTSQDVVITDVWYEGEIDIP